VLWDIRKSTFHLADQCIAVRPEIASVAKEIGRACERLLPTCWIDLSKQGNRNRRDNYFFRFVLPVAELSGWPSKSPKNLADHLLAQLTWCLAWRALDDVLDSSGRSNSALRRLILTYSDALTVTLETAPSSRSRLIQKLAQMHAISCDVADKEMAGRLEISQAWQRSSQFFIVPVLLLRLRKSQLDRYRNYVNAAALAHDVQHLVTDLKTGIKSPPVRWLHQTQADFHFRPQSLRNWFQRAARELDKRISLCREQIDSNSAILRVLIQELEDILHELQHGI
jgi:hypothetical protein